MRQTFIVIALVLGSFTVKAPVSAQEYQGCFTVDRSGLMTDLSYMCANVTRSNSVSNTGVSSNSVFPVETQQGDTLPSNRSSPFNSGSSGSSSRGGSGRSRSDLNSDGSINIGDRFTGGGGLNTRNPFDGSSGSGSNGGGSQTRGSGVCNYASDYAGDGSRCGGRASSQRPGGR